MNTIEKQIAKDAISKHNLKINPEDENILGLIRYVYNIGFNAGINSSEKLKERDLNNLLTRITVMKESMEKII